MEKLTSIMFHDLHNKIVKPTQGSVSSDEFLKIIDFTNSFKKITMSADLSKLNSGEILDSVFLTFDDGLKNQYEVGGTLLQDTGITAFFFIHTAPLNNDFDVHQILRIFRNSSLFNDVEEFNKKFIKFLFDNINEKKHKEINYQFEKSSYFSQFTFYTYNDRKLRYIRDFHFSHNEYKDLSLDFIKSFNININFLIKETYMDEKSILHLHSMGHSIGLHSHSHASNLRILNEEEQSFEIQKNIDILYQITGEKPIAMSYPSNSYNELTIKILKSKNIKFAFRADNLKASVPYELPRIDARMLLDGID